MPNRHRAARVTVVDRLAGALVLALFGTSANAGGNPPPVCGDPDAGDCITPNGTPGCIHAACCEQICNQHPHCCEVGWDDECADQALEFCSLCDCTLDSECGAGRACVDGTCALIPTGACCQCDGANQFCEEMTAADCLTTGGTYLGDAIGCESGRIVVESCADERINSTTDTISVEESFEIFDIDVEAVISHTWTGELCVTLQKDNGPSVLLIERIALDMPCGIGCCGCSSDHLNITLSDEADGGSIDDQCVFPPALTGVFVPQEPLSAFDGLDSAGDWTLTVSDREGSADIGHLRRWGLHLTGPAHDPLPCSVISCACPWDLDGDGKVGVLDIFELIASFGPCDGCPADFDGDGFVGVMDFLAMLMNFGPCPDGACPWDVNGDGVVDGADLQAVFENFGPCDGCPEDVNGDGVVDFEDVIAVVMHFGPCP